MVGLDSLYSVHALKIEWPDKTVQVFWLMGPRDYAKGIYISILCSYFRGKVEDYQLQREARILGL